MSIRVDGIFKANLQHLDNSTILIKTSEYTFGVKNMQMQMQMQISVQGSDPENTPRFTPSSTTAQFHVNSSKKYFKWATLLWEN